MNHRVTHYFSQKEMHTSSKKYIWIFFGILISLFSGALMVGHGLRMIYQGVFQPGSYYAPNLFDLYFDWLILVILGCFLFGLSCFQFYKQKSVR